MTTPTDRDAEHHPSRMNAQREREPGDPLRVVFVGRVDDVDVVPWLPDVATGLMTTAVLGRPDDRDTLDSMWALILTADVVVGITAIDAEGDVVCVPMVSDALNVAATWGKHAILCTEKPDDGVEIGNCKHRDVLELTGDELQRLLAQLVTIDWHAPNALGWKVNVQSLEDDLPRRPHTERIVGGAFAGLPAHDVLATIVEMMRGDSDPLLTILGSETNAIMVPEHMGERAARAFALAQEDKAHWFRWPDGFLEWSKKAIAGLRRTEHPAGYFDRAMRDVRAWDCVRFAELLRLRAKYLEANPDGTPGFSRIAAELRLLADVAELALRVGEDGSIDPEDVRRARALVPGGGR